MILPGCDSVVTKSSQRSQSRHKGLKVVTNISKSSQRSQSRHKDLKVVTQISKSSQRSQSRHEDLKVVTKISKSSQRSQSRHKGYKVVTKVSNIVTKVTKSSPLTSLTVDYLLLSRRVFLFKFQASH